MGPAWLFWGPTRASHSCFRAFKFRNPTTERDFQRHCEPLRVVLASAYFVFAALLNGVHAVSFSGHDLPAPFWCFLAISVLPAMALVTLWALPPVRRHVLFMHAATVLVSLMVFSYLSLALARHWAAQSLPPLRQQLPADAAELVSGVLTFMFGNLSLFRAVYCIQFHLTALAFMGFGYTIVAIWLCYLTVFTAVTVLSGTIAWAHVAYYAPEACLSVSPFLALGICVEALQRSNYYAQQELRRELEVSQTAEGMLNTTVKNGLADAAANLQEFLNAGPQATVSVLQDTLLGLTRGLRFCRQRQAFLALVSDTYEPHFLEVSLKHFGEELLAGRAVAGDFVDERVLLDPLLCGLVLENAMAQAFQYGHPDGPDVRVRIFPKGARRPTVVMARYPVEVVLEVSFIADDDGVDICNERLLPQGSVPSHHMTQRYLSMAANAHGMTTRWLQEQERVTFRAAFVAQLAHTAPRPRDSAPAPLSQLALDAFPAQLTFYIIDDSAPARRLLASSITRTASPAAVHSYGAAPEDVHQFVGAASQDGDIVICDQHLDYGDQHYLGTDLVRALRDRGFQGLLCMRSSDVDQPERELYYASGAHCAFGKEELCKDVVDHIKAAYVELKGLHRQETTATTTLSSIEDSSVSPRVSRTITIGWEASSI
eukprot:EG_transcript_4711